MTSAATPSDDPMEKRERRGTYDADRSDMLHLVPEHAKSVLDVGCAHGRFGEQLRATRTLDRLAAVEADQSAADDARSTYDEVFVGTFPEVQPLGERFDCIVFNDVLEHMVDPWSAVAACDGLLESGGALVTSLPNIRYWPVVRQLLLRGRFDYTTAGVLDRSHLRWFTRSSMVGLFEDAGYAVEVIEPVNSIPRSWKWKLVAALTRGGSDDLLVQQFGLVAVRRE